MATFKAVILKHRMKADNSFDVKIRITHKSVQRFVPTPFNVALKDISKLSLQPGNDLKITNRKISDDVNAIIKQYKKISNDLGEGIYDMNVDQFKEHLHYYKESSIGSYPENIINGKTQIKNDGENDPKIVIKQMFNDLKKVMEESEKQLLKFCEEQK